MNAKIRDLMTAPVMTATPRHTFVRVKSLLREHRASCLPVVDAEGRPVGMVTISDLLHERPDNQPVSEFMSRDVLTIPMYADVSLAARMIRNHQIHHLVVTDEKKVVGLISSYDLLKLVEDHRFVMKNPPTETAKKGGQRQKKEAVSKPR